MTGAGAHAIARALGQPPPTPEQTRIIEHPPASMLVVAGAGSGKTETMASRVVWLVANGHVEPRSVLGLTFTRKAAGELAERIERRLRRLQTTGLWTPAAEAPGAAVDERPSGPSELPGSSEAPGASGLTTAEPPTISTYHAYAGRLLRDHGLRLGVENDARLLTQAAAWQLAHEAVTTYDGDLDGLDAAESTITQAVLALSAELAEHLRAPADVEAVLSGLGERVAGLPLGGRRRGVPAQVAALLAHARGQRAILPLLERYAALKRRRDCLDFADQMALAARLVQRYPDVAAAERARHTVVLLDEFQDTSEAQLRLLESLFADPAASDPVPVMAVGDPNQSIYGWRGASATTLSAFTERFGAGRRGVPTLPLSTSWRNDVAILDAANTLAEPLRRGSPVDVARLVPAPAAGPGRLWASRELTHVEEAQRVADWVAQRWWASDADGRRSGASAAVLCRRRAQFPAVVDALRDRGLPVEVVGVGGLLLTPEVGDLHALLGVAADPARGDMLMRLLTGPAVRLGAADLDALAAWTRRLHRPPRTPAEPDQTGGSDEAREAREAHEVREASEASLVPVGEVHDAPSIIEAVHRLPPPGWTGPDGQWLSAPARSRLHVLESAIGAARRAADQPLSDIVRVAEEALGLDVEVAARPGADWATARVHLDAFADVARDFEAAADRPGLDGFLAWLEVARTEERGLETPASHASEDCVQVLTVHAAKGLEWDVVAIPGLLEGSFPSYRFGRSTPEGDRWVLGPPKDRGWVTGLDRIPYELRGDAAALPVLGWRYSATMNDLESELEDFAQDGGRHGLSEERRLAYVALTRARHEALLSASVWAEAGSPRVTSRFLTELLDNASTDVEVLDWVAMPATDDPSIANPLQDSAPVALWPVTNDDAARAAVHAAAADLVRRHRSGDTPAPDVEEFDEQTAALLHEADLLVERRELDRRELDRRARSPEPAAELGDPGDPGGPVDPGGPGGRHDLDDAAARLMPGHLSTSQLVRYAEDPEGFVADLRRPVPARPSRGRRAGTQLHRWIEQHYGKASIVDLDDLPGSADDELGPDLEQAKARFLASEWASREPVAVELPIETVVDGVPLRGRIDAVFPDPRNAKGVVIVDWKSSRPTTGDRLRARTLQLSAYRVAYARLAGLPLDDVAAAFYHAATGQTVYPPRARDAEEDLRRHVAALRTGGERDG